jgi:hypothetical protein
MSPDVPPEAEVIRLAREAMDMTAQRAAEASRAHDGKGVSAAYWRDVERGYGGRRGQRVPTRASARALAAMARVVGVVPPQLAAAGREDAARVLEEILRREQAPPLTSSGTAALAPLAATSEPDAEDAAKVTRAVIAAIRPLIEAQVHEEVAALAPRLEREVQDEVLRYPPGTPASVVFPDPVEAMLFSRDAPEEQRIRWIAALRSVPENPPVPARRAG